MEMPLPVGRLNSQLEGAPVANNASLLHGNALRHLTGGTIGNIASMTPAVYAVFGTFLIPVTQEFGWPRATFSLGLLIIALSAALVYPLSGYIADRVGGRKVLAVGYALMAAAIANMALMKGSTTGLFISFLLVGICGAIPSNALLTKLISERFRGQATALAITAGGGNAIGCMVMPILAAAALSSSGWRGAYLTIAGAVVLLGTIALVLLRGTEMGPSLGEPTKETGKLDGALRDPTFWLLFLVIGCGAGVSCTIFSHLVPIAAERGVGLHQATAALSLNAMVSLVAQISSARLLDRVSTPRFIVIFYFIGGLGLALLQFGPGYSSVMTGVSLLGIASGMQFAALPFLIGRYFSFRQFGLLVSLMYSAVVVAQGILPVGLDAVFDASGSYQAAIFCGCIAYFVGGVALLLLPAYRKHVLDGSAHHRDPTGASDTHSLPSSGRIERSPVIPENQAEKGTQ